MEEVEKRKFCINDGNRRWRCAPFQTHLIIHLSLIYFIWCFGYLVQFYLILLRVRLLFSCWVWYLLAVLQMRPTHNFDTFISISSPIFSSFSVSLCTHFSSLQFYSAFIVNAPIDSATLFFMCLFVSRYYNGNCCRCHRLPISLPFDNFALL